MATLEAEQRGIRVATLVLWVLFIVLLARTCPDGEPISGKPQVVWTRAD